MLKSIHFPSRYTVDYRIRASILSAVVLSNTVTDFQNMWLTKTQKRTRFRATSLIYCYNKCQNIKGQGTCKFRSTSFCSLVFTELITYLKRAVKIKSLFSSHYSLRSTCFTPCCHPYPSPHLPSVAEFQTPENQTFLFLAIY